MKPIKPLPPKEEMSLEEKMADVRLVAMELEGVVSDGKVLWSPEGEGFFTFYRDELAIKRWVEEGGRALVMVREGMEAASRWAGAMGVELAVHKGDKDKLLRAAVIGEGLSPAQVCYIGRELEDLPAMMIAAVKACPPEASEWVKEVADIVTTASGGAGAVAEIVEKLLEARDKPGQEPGDV